MLASELLPLGKPKDSDCCIEGRNTASDRLMKGMALFACYFYAGW